MQSSTILVSFNNSLKVKVKQTLTVVEGNLYLETYTYNNKKNNWQLLNTTKIHDDCLEKLNNIPPTSIDLFSIE